MIIGGCYLDLAMNLKSKDRFEETGKQIVAINDSLCEQLALTFTKVK